MRNSRPALIASLCLVAVLVQACALSEPPQGQITDPGQWPDLGQYAGKAEPEGKVLTPEEQQAAIESLKRRNP